MKYRQHVSEWIFDIVNHLFLVILAVSMVYPFLNVLALSVSKPLDALTMGVNIIPKNITLEAYRQVIDQGMIGRAYLNTIIRTVSATMLNLLCSFSVAFVLSKRDLPYRKGITFFFVFTMYFSGGMIPSYLLIKSLGLINRMGALILPALYGVYNIVMIRNYIGTIPHDLVEAAVIDGATPFRTMAQIIFPLATPILATVALWNAVGNWNAWFDAMIYIQDNKKQVLQVILQKLIIMQRLEAEMPELAAMNTGMERNFSDLTLKSALIMLTIGPIIFIYPFVQKYYIKGIVAGSVIVPKFSNSIQKWQDIGQRIPSRGTIQVRETYSLVSGR
jgi:putative aldouronate transport system permease protein